MRVDAAETGHLQSLLSRVGAALDEFVAFKHPDALHPGHTWRDRLDLPLPYAGVGIDQVSD
jgi:aromatic-L-amino-acid decarboxylase